MIGDRYKVAIRKNETGEVRVRDMEEMRWAEGSEYWWSEGNYGCDCNRAREFLRAGGANEYDVAREAPTECSEGGYSILYFEFPKGVRFLLNEAGILQREASCVN